MITIVALRIGADTAIVLIVTGQIICALLIDHFGWPNVPVHAIGSTHITGILIMTADPHPGMRKWTRCRTCYDCPIRAWFGA